MADTTLCMSQECPVRTRCRRNHYCATAYPAHPTYQSYAYWHPESGAGCSGFIEATDLPAEERKP